MGVVFRQGRGRGPDQECTARRVDTATIIRPSNQAVGAGLRRSAVPQSGRRFKVRGWTSTQAGLVVAASFRT